MVDNIVHKLGNGNPTIVGAFRIFVLGVSTTASLLLLVVAWIADNAFNKLDHMITITDQLPIIQQAQQNQIDEINKHLTDIDSKLLAVELDNAARFGTKLQKR